MHEPFEIAFAGNWPEHLAMRIDVRISPQFDLCYALADLAFASPHTKHWPGLNAGSPWFLKARAFGSAFWAALPDLLEDQEPSRNADEFLRGLAAISTDAAVAHLRRSLIHTAGPKSAPDAEKMEWLRFIGGEQAVDEDEWRKRASDYFKQCFAVLREFRRVFDPVWGALLPQLRESRQTVEQLASSTSLNDIIERLGLAVQLDTGTGVLKALRGGYSLAMARVDTVFLVPSAFNTRLLWNAADNAERTFLFFPYLVDELKLPFGMSRRDRAGAVDPWLVCRAIGDISRSTILRLLAVQPRSASELMRELGLSKGTISEHIFLLRHAGLIAERRIGRSIELSVNRDTVRALGTALDEELEELSASVKADQGHRA